MRFLSSRKENLVLATYVLLFCIAQEDHNKKDDDKSDTDNYANDHSRVGTVI